MVLLDPEALACNLADAAHFPAEGGSISLAAEIPSAAEMLLLQVLTNLESLQGARCRLGQGLCQAYSKRSVRLTCHVRSDIQEAKKPRNTVMKVTQSEIEILCAKMIK